MSGVRPTGGEYTHLANTDKHARHGPVQRLGQVVVLRRRSVDEVQLRGQALEEQVAARRVRVRLDVHLREVRLNDAEQLMGFTCLDALDLQVDMARLVLGRA